MNTEMNTELNKELKIEDRKEILKVEDLQVSFYTPVGEVQAVDKISYTLHENEIMGIVGESDQVNPLNPMRLWVFYKVLAR